MFEEIKTIDPEKMGVSELRQALSLLLNIVEGQASMIEKQAIEIQSLKDDINKMKGEHGSYTPRQSDVSSDLPKRRKNRKAGKKGGKKAKLEVDKTIRCEIDKSKLPEDAKLHRYDKLIQQDIIIKRNNILFEVPVYYSKSTGKTYRGELPCSYQGQFGGQLKGWIQLLHHNCDVTQSRLKALLKNLGIEMSTGTVLSRMGAEIASDRVYL